MTTSIPINTSKSEKATPCQCDKRCGCCLKRKEAADVDIEMKEPGFLGKRPWLFVVMAFVLLFSAWSALFYIATKYRIESVPLVNSAESH